MYVFIYNIRVDRNNKKKGGGGVKRVDMVKKEVRKGTQQPNY